jgi:hypothetical protein
VSEGECLSSVFLQAANWTFDLASKVMPRGCDLWGATTWLRLQLSAFGGMGFITFLSTIGVVP